METQRWKQWDGKYPSYVIQPGAGLDGRAWVGFPALPGEPQRKTALAETPGK
jgi:hypothetical protein